MFVNTLAMRSRIEGSDSFAAFLAKVKATCLEAYEHQDAPFEKVVDSLHLQRNLALTPLFQIMVILQNAERAAADAAIQPYPLDGGISKFDLTVAFSETEDGLAAGFEYNTALFKAETISRMARHFTALCQAVAAAPMAEVRALQYLGEAERHALLVRYNDTAADYEKDRCLHELFTEQAARSGENTAVVCGDAQLTYNQLEERSRALALVLQAQGVGPDTLVGVCMQRTPDLIVSLLGILRAGGAYVPLDPEYPNERLAYMLRDSGASIVLTQESLIEKLSGLVAAGTQLLAVDRPWPEATGQALREDVRPHNLAYVIYTSGSTGQPKGVAIEHHSPVTLVQWGRDVYSSDELAGVLASTSVCFDLSVYEIFLTLASGGTILLVKNALALAEPSAPTGVTLINTVPSAMEELVRLNAIPESIQTINLAGEPLPARLVDRIYDTTPARKVYDLYGPSEDTTYSTYVLRTKNGPQTIGRPIANTRVYILDAHHQLQPIGVPGELHIAGDGLARGYLNRAELTEEKFVANPFEGGTRMYKTGDLARWQDDGTLQYLGRIDTQVKVRGFRIEMGEIEARLNEHPTILDAVVIAQGQGAERQLVAFYRAENTALAADELRSHLLQTLPDYMVPTAFVSLDAIPLHPNGKVDRRALARMDVTAVASTAYAAPRNEAETQLVAIWAGILNLVPENIGINDNFFELGGHSLLATRLISKIRSQFSVDLPLRVLFEGGTVAQLAERIAKAESRAVPAIVPVDRSQFERLPLSFSQERLWFLNQLAPNTAGYNIPGAVRLRGALDIEQVEEAFNYIIARHENLRTVFPSDEGQARQRILDRVDLTIERIDLSDYADQDARDATARQLCQTDASTPFDLVNGPLLRGKVIKLSEDEHILMLNMHHIISDGWSITVLLKELGVIMEAFRQGRDPELPPLPIQYVDYSIWQRQLLEEGGVLDRQLAYWQQKLAGVPEGLDLATDYPRPAVQNFAGASRAFSLDGPLTGQLKRLAEEQGSTLYMVLLAAFKVLLYRYTGQSDLCVGSPIANRQYGETEGLIGMFVNTLALRSEVDGEEPFAALLAQVRATCLEAYEHQDTPFEKVVDAVSRQRNLGISPLFQVMLVLQNNESVAADASIQPYPLGLAVAKFDLTAEFTETPEGLAGSIRYSTALYKRQTIERMVDHFIALCRAITATPTAKIYDLDYIGEAEKRQLLTGQAGDGNGRLVHQLFAAQVASNPHKAAVVCGERELSYQELYDKSRDLASYLQAQGVVPDSLVGLYLDRSPEMMVGLFGILLAGGAYVPLDPEYPAERLQYMVEDAAPSIVLTQERLKGTLPRTTARMIALDSEWAVIDRHARTNADSGPVRVGPDNLAYVLYTSGSTGVPKGVMVEHGNLSNYLVWAHGAYYRKAGDGSPAIHSIGFDGLLTTLFGPLVAGQTLRLLPRGSEMECLAPLCSSGSFVYTMIKVTPSHLKLLNQLIADDANRAPAAALMIGGEALVPSDILFWQRRFPQVRLINHYGPTETTIGCCTFEIAAPIDGIRSIPIGRPIANTRIYILDPRGKPVPVGVAGELYVSGAGVARGYLNRPDLTKEKFLPDPFSSDPGARMYRTGDLGRWLPEGDIEFMGRIDTQVKIRGFRIELGEIEARLHQHPGIQECAVIAKGEGTNRQLIAFYRAKKSTADRIVELPHEELRTQLLRTLPEYMVPAAFVSLAALPLSPHRKVDRRALERMDVTLASGQEYVAPRNDTERRLVAIWSEVLDRAPETIGVKDNFFELGGHSLLAVLLLAKTNRQFKRVLPLTVLFTAPSIAAFAELLSADETAPSFDIVVPIQTNGDAPPVFAVPGVGGSVLSLRPLVKALGDRQPFFALQAVGLDGKTPPLDTVEQTAQANIEALKTVQPAGPYSLIGHSYGGVVAYEMARRLVEQGEEISSLILLDSIAPSVMQRERSHDETADLLEACMAVANLYDIKVEVDTDRLRRSPLEENVQYLAGLLNESGLAIGDQFAAFYRVYRANLLCYRSYTPSMLSQELDVSLHRATQAHQNRPDMPDDYGWNQLLQRPIRTYDVDATHLSILEKCTFNDDGRES
jgi:amino acid adenylation domain-containing protein